MVPAGDRDRDAVAIGHNPPASQPLPDIRWPVSRNRRVVTSLDVARRAGVSQSAVSRALASQPTQSGVSAEVRQRVMAAADQLGYRPNAIARSLITRRSRTVGLLFSYLDNPFYAGALERFCHVLQARHHHAMVFMMPDTVEGAERTMSALLEHRVDGIITATVELSSELCAFCLAADMPIVAFNRTQDAQRLSSVTCDNADGGRQVARYLLAGGHRRIAMLAGWEGASTNRDREAGFNAQLAGAGAQLFDRRVGHFDLPSTVEATRAMFAPARPSDRPDAVFVANDWSAIAVLDTLRHELGLRVPEDVSVIGFDDIATAALPPYDLTTVRQPIRRMVDATARLLFENMERAAPGNEPADDEAEHVVLGARLVERGSARRPHRSTRPAAGPVT